MKLPPPSVPNDSPENLLTPRERVAFLNSLPVFPERRWKIWQYADQDVSNIDTYVLREGHERYLGSIVIKGFSMRAYRFHEGCVGEITFSAASEAEALMWANDIVEGQT